MKIFINNKPVNFYGSKKDLSDFTFNHKLKPEESVEFSDLKGHILVESNDAEEVVNVLEHFIGHDMVKVSQLTFVLKKKKKKILKEVKKHFKLIKAAGGIVEKDDEILMIYRLKKWDLPKGKLEKNESIEDCAVREVEEECNIKVKRKEKIGVTWHYYVSGSFFKKQKKNLKKTVWYRMKIVDDAAMTPQKKEGIVNLKWMKKDEVEAALNNSYESIRHIVDKYYTKKKKKVSKKDKVKVA